MDYNVRMIYINFLGGGIEPALVEQKGLVIKFLYFSGGRSFGTEFNLNNGDFVHRVRP